MALKKLDFAGEVMLMDSKNFAKFREYLNRFGLLDTTTALLQKKEYREHAAIFFKEFDYSLPAQQQVDLAKNGREDFVVAYFTSFKMSASALVCMIERKSERILRAYKALYGENSLDDVDAAVSAEQLV